MHYGRGFACVLTGAVVVAICAAHSRSQAVPAKPSRPPFPRVPFGQLGVPVGKLTFVKRGPLPAAAASLPVYRVQPLKSKRALMQQLFRALPIESTPETAQQIDAIGRLREPVSMPEGDSFDAYVGGWEVCIWQSGQFHAMIVPEPTSTWVDGAKAPTEAQARKVADEIVDRIKPLLPEEVKFSSVFPCERWDDVVMTLGVSYTTKMSGIPVAGQVFVEVGPRGELLRVMSWFRQRVVADNAVPIISLDEAIRMLQGGKGHVSNGPAWDATAYVDSVKLVYWQAVLAIDYSYVMPVYVLGGEAVAKGKETSHWSARLEAVRPELLEKEHLEGSLDRE